METTGQRILQKLETLGKVDFEGTKNGERCYRTNSPLRAGSDSWGFVLFIAEDGEHGGYHDHAFQVDQGSLYDLAGKLGIPLPEREATEVPSSKIVYRDIRHYAQAHGIPVDALKKAGWYETTHSCKVKGESVFTDRHCLAFPTTGGMRYRYLDGKKPYYTSEKGYKRCWYGLKGPTFKRLIEGQPLIITNGEISVVCAHYWGLAAACVTAGENSNRKGQPFPPELVEELSQQLGDNPTPILVAMDCDPQGRASARVVVEQLRGAGFNVQAIDLGLTSKGDLADFCMLHEEKSLEALLQCSSPAEANNDGKQIIVREDGLNFMIIHESLLHLLPPLTWLIKGLLVEHGTNMLYGKSGVFKSFYALALALQIGQERPVLYIAREGEAGFLVRTEAWYKHNGLSSRAGKCFFLYGQLSLLKDQHIDALLLYAASIRPALVVVDTVAMSMIGGDENSNRDMGFYLDACKRIESEFGCATLLVHHSQKGGDEARGASALGGACDQIIHMTRDDMRVCIEISKAKDGKVPPVSYMEWLTVPLGVDDKGEVVDSGVLVPVDKILHEADEEITPQQQKFLEVLAMEQYQAEGADLADVLDLAGLTKGSALRTANRLLARKYIIQPNGPRSPRVITELGLKALEDYSGTPVKRVQGKVIVKQFGTRMDSLDSFDEE